MANVQRDTGYTYQLAKRTQLRTFEHEGHKFNARILLRHRKHFPQRFEVFIETCDVGGGVPRLNYVESCWSLEEAKTCFENIKAKFLREPHLGVVTITR